LDKRKLEYWGASKDGNWRLEMRKIVDNETPPVNERGIGKVSAYKF
jgi:hypothetical protein